MVKMTPVQAGVFMAIRPDLRLLPLRSKRFRDCSAHDRAARTVNLQIASGPNLSSQWHKGNGTQAVAL